MKRMLLAGYLLLCVFGASSKGQDLVEEQELTKLLRSQKFQIDLDAHAIVVQDKGSVIFTYSDRNTYNQLTVKRMVRIIDGKGMDISNVSVTLQENQTIASVATCTYSLLNGKKVIVKTPDNAYTETESDSGRVIRLNFKDAAPGTILYYTYTIKTAKSYNIPAWYFEGKYPVLHSEFMITADFGTEFAVISNKNTPFQEVPEETDMQLCNNCRYNVNQKNTSLMSRSSIWAKNNIPAAKGAQDLKMENITVQLAMIRIDKQLANSNNAYNLNRNDEYLQDIELRNWEQVNKKLLYGNENLGKIVYASNGNLEDLLESILKGKNNDLDRARAIFDYVKNDIRLKSKEDGIYAGNTLKKVLQQKAGSVAEKNLLLISMLRKAGLDCEPVVLTTTKYEPLRSDFPVYSRLNYVVGRFRSGGKEYFLDASDPATAFGDLKPECYNGLAYVVNKAGSFVTLNK